MRLQKLLIFLFLFILNGCAASLPAVDYDSLRAADTGDAASHLDYVRAQSERIAGRPFIGGNKVTLLENGAAAYPAMLKAIGSARQRVDMESFLFDGEEGAHFADALLKSHAKGVDVNLIYDAIGSLDAPEALFDRLREGGVNVVEYNPIDVLSIVDTDINHRDHRKLLMIDGKTAFIGGINISSVYRLQLKMQQALHIHSDNLDPDRLPWRDTQIKIEGPVVGEFERLFMQVWHDQDGPPISSPPAVPAKPRGSLLVEAIDGTPGRERYKVYESLLLAMALARHSIHVTTAFFVPTPDLVDALENAAHRGVEVILILPSQSDSDLAMDASHAYYEDLLESGVQIYEREGVVLHAKTAVIDGVWSTVGSSNLDWRSALLNNECNAVVLGSAFGQQMESMFQQDIAQSKRIDPQTWGDRPFFDRLHEWKAQLVEYLL